MEYEDSYNAQIIMWKSLMRDAHLINDHYRAAYVATRMMWSAFNLGAQFADLHRREQDEQVAAEIGPLNMPPWQE